LSGLNIWLDLIPAFPLKWEKVEKSGGRRGVARNPQPPKEEQGMGGTFHGATVVTLDAKGRLAIPTRHREALLASSKYLVLTAHPEGCVLVYPPAAWEPVRAKAESFPSFHPQASWGSGCCSASKSTSHRTPRAGSSFRARCASTPSSSAT
jgi:hypothetical protein